MAAEKTVPSEQTIREQAYHLWEQHGRPSGRDLEFWSRAAAMLATVRPSPKRAAAAGNKPAAAAADKPVARRRTKAAA